MSLGVGKDAEITIFDGSDESNTSRQSVTSYQKKD
ncbi:hypothetical protein ACVXZZ_12205 [Staphylococcus aureus]